MGREGGVHLRYRARVLHHPGYTLLPASLTDVQAGQHAVPGVCTEKKDSPGLRGLSGPGPGRPERLLCPEWSGFFEESYPGRMRENGRNRTKIGRNRV